MIKVNYKFYHNMCRSPNTSVALKYVLDYSPLSAGEKVLDSIVKLLYIAFREMRAIHDDGAQEIRCITGGFCQV